VTIDEAMYALARAQGGAFARRQVHANGGMDSLIERRCAAGLWKRVRPGVYVVPGLPPSKTTDLWVAWLEVGPHAVRSHECAAEHWGLQPVMADRRVFTTRQGDHHKIPGVVVHQLGDLLPDHTTVVDDMPITTAPRTVVDLAAVVGFERLKRIVENGVNDRIVTDESVGLVLRDVARRGKWGMKKLARVLAMRAPGEPVPDSQLERMLLDALRSVGLPDPVAQFPHPGREIGTGWVDLAYPKAKLILEADGRRWHQRIAQIGLDHARDKAANRAGWLTMRFMYEELTADPIDAGLSVRETLAHRTAA
jgi:very-short-patch-repair endonuclease